MGLSIFIPVLELHYLYNRNYRLDTADTVIVLSLIFLLMIDLILGLYLNFRNYTKLEIDEENHAKYYVPDKVGIRRIESALALTFDLRDIQEVTFKNHPFTHGGRLIMKINRPLSHSRKDREAKGKRIHEVVSRSIIISTEDMNLLNRRLPSADNESCAK